MFTLIVFIAGVMVGSLFGVFLMGLLVASRDRDDADRAYREHRVNGQSANEQRNASTSQGIRSHASKFPQETDIR